MTDNHRDSPFRVVFLFAFLIFLAVTARALQSQDILILKDEPRSGHDKNSTDMQKEEDEHIPASQPFLVLYDMWRDYESAYQAGDKALAEEMLGELIKLKGANKIPRLTEFSIALIERGNLKWSQGDAVESLKLFRAATALDPYLPYAYYSESRVLSRRGVSGWIPAASTALEGFLAPYSSVNGRLFFTLRIAILIGAVLLLAGFLFSAVLMLKYNRLLRHDAAEKFNTRNPRLMHFLTWVFLFLPVLLLAGPFWLAPFWLMVFLLYSNTGERVLAVLFFVVFAAAFPLYKMAVQLAEASIDQKTSRYITAFSEGASPRVIQDFQQYHFENPDDTDAAIFLAHLYKIDQRTGAAMELLQKHILNKPSDGRAYNNLANLYYLQGDTETAYRLAQKAASLDGSNAVFIYNLARLQRAKFNFKEADKLMEQARALDPSFVRRVQESPEDALIDAIPSFEKTMLYVNERYSGISGAIANPFSAVVLLMFVVGVVIAFFRTRAGYARDCIKCGRPFCRRCQPSSREFSFCTQCLHIYVKKDGVSPASRKQKMREIEMYTNRRRVLSRVASLVLPGSGSLYQNRIAFGMIVLLAWLFLVTFIFFNRSVVQYFPVPPGNSNVVLTIVAVVLMLFVYLIANLPRVKRA